MNDDISNLCRHRRPMVDLCSFLDSESDASLHDDILHHKMGFVSLF